MEELGGYRGRALEFLKKAGAEVGDVIEVTTDWGKVTGTLVPRYLYDDEQHLVMKLASGYNVGILVSKLKAAKVAAKGEKPSFTVPPVPKAEGGLPKVLVIGTGGTIASRVDYRTGGVHPVVSSEELHALVPELSQIADIRPEVMFSIYSENIEPHNWSQLAERVKRAVEERYHGVVITQGTDTMGYTAAALSFALTGVPVPVVLTASQRSSDRPSSDATLNLIGAVSVAAGANFAGVYVAMHANESDDVIAIHRGTRVRKNHTSARGAFESVGVPPAALWTREGLTGVVRGLPERREGRSNFNPRTKFESRVALVKFFPSMPPSIIEYQARVGVKAIVLEGTGLGHVNSKSIPAIRDFVKKGGLVFMTSQCVEGRVDMDVYDTGRDLTAAGVVPLEDMLAETALVKSMWAMGNAAPGEDAKKLMTENLAGEMTARRFE